jgi:hypothetical protein
MRPAKGRNYIGQQINDNIILFLLLLLLFFCEYKTSVYDSLHCNLGRRNVSTLKDRTRELSRAS